MNRIDDDVYFGIRLKFQSKSNWNPLSMLLYNLQMTSFYIVIPHNPNN